MEDAAFPCSRVAPVRGSGAMRNADLRAVVDRFAEARIALVGDLVADEYLYGETERVSREVTTALGKQAARAIVGVLG